MALPIFEIGHKVQTPAGCLEFFGLSSVKTNRRYSREGHRKGIWKCTCGTFFTIPNERITRGKATSCGCYKYYLISLTKGKQKDKMPVGFKVETPSGFLFFLERVASHNNPKGLWLCFCDKLFIRENSIIRTGKIISCGCLDLIEKPRHFQSETATYNAWAGVKRHCKNKSVEMDSRWAEFEAFWVDMGDKPEDAILARIDEDLPYCKENCIWDSPYLLLKSPKLQSTYNTWRGMIERCTNPNGPSAKYYILRGITIEDPRWYEFRYFYEDMGERPEGKTLDRKDNYSGYSKSNCVWSSSAEQHANRRDVSTLEFEKIAIQSELNRSKAENNQLKQRLIELENKLKIK